jgi:aldehyde dehydrogenase (NAD+)
MNDILAALGLKATNPGTWSQDGGWIAGADAPTLESENPANGSVIARVTCSTAADYERVIASSRKAFEEWRKVPAPKRGECVRLIGEELRRNKAALGKLVSLEVGKIQAEGAGEVQEMIDIADFAVGQSRMLYGNTMHSERPQHRMYEQWHPLGIVGIISAFNFPVAVWSWNALLAAVCGDSCIWKPSAKAPLSAIAVQHIVNRVMAHHQYPGIFQLIVDQHTQLAERMVDDRRIDLLSFTGSTQVGRRVGERVGARLGKSLLELGGNNAIVVDEFANLDIAIPAVVFGAVGTAGQRCTSTRRVLVHESRLAEFEQRLVAAYEQVRIGDPLTDGTLMGPLIDSAAVERYRAAIETAKQLGGKVLCGEEVMHRAGHWVKPTIIRAKNEWPIVQSETFAPILYVIPFKTLDEAIHMHNAVHHGLSSAIFTDNVRHSELFLSALGSDCGIANVNIGTSGAEIGGAFGGEKETGGGRESGSDAWQAYMRRQTNTINWSRDLPLAQGIKFDVSPKS